MIGNVAIQPNSIMNILLIGDGGREHAIAWKLTDSPKLKKLYIAPGNAGTAMLGQNVNLNLENPAEVVRFAEDNKIALAIIGPAEPLAAGLGDALSDVGVAVFGPSQAAVQIESDKAFAKDFLTKHNLPTARYAAFTEYSAACEYLADLDYPIVIKATGLADGKGAILPQTHTEAKLTLRDLLLDNRLGKAGSTVVIEEYLEGVEVSLLAFSDGKTVKAMPTAQDHKRLRDGGLGPNTGGMGAYAPVPNVAQSLIDRVMETIMQPTIDGMRAAGTPFVGVLYAGLMLTDAGPQVLEFNARFGDPEAQVILTLLKSDLIEIGLACINGTLDEVEIDWYPDAAACVVMAANGYPNAYASGIPIDGLDAAKSDYSEVFHGGTKLLHGNVLSAGGRVLGVTGWGADFRAAIDNAYLAAEKVEFAGAHYRRDIGFEVLNTSVEFS